MSNYHVKTVSEDGRNASVVFHIPVPAENNSAGVALRTALSQMIDSATFVSQVPWIAGAELTQLKNGELYEYADTVHFYGEDNNAQKQTRLDNKYTSLATDGVDRLREILKFWGFNRDI